MKQTFKVAAWEIKRNLKNKSFIISLFLTPAIIALFVFLPTLFEDSEQDSNTIHLFVDDELGLLPEIETLQDELELVHWEISEVDLNETDIKKQLADEDNAAYVALTEEIFTEDVLTVYTSEKIDEQFNYEINFLSALLKQHQLAEFSFTEEEIAIITQDIPVHLENVKDAESETTDEATTDDGMAEADAMTRIVPGMFSGIILFSIVISGMMIFQSASQEKKDKIAEIILSSITPNELMQGKIIGYFILGLIQVTVWLGLAAPVILWRSDIPILKYLFVPELAVLLVIAILGYLIFASIFVGLGATIEDISTSGNFQGLVFMLPFLPLVLLGPVVNDPSGIVAKICSYIPFTSPGILLVRLTIMDDWPITEIMISIAILIISVWILMKLAGKIFRTSILMYGKNATPMEIWRWLWS